MSALDILSEQDKLIIKALQEDFPLCAEPYKVLAEQVGISEETFLQRVKELIDEKKIRKMGAVLRHREVGFNANALCAWHVSPENLDSVAQIMSAHAAVSHCYDRTPAPNWNYNLYTMIHAKTRDECEQFIGELAQMTGVTDYRIMYTKREWKKTGMKYFCEAT
ncbi:MAG: AsnC family transcriptional regulator [Selenomonadaceae bacterium]|nr:AsnC family transcriptional regulator [Selenomonadaceae bacterium]